MRFKPRFEIVKCNMMQLKTSMLGTLYKAHFFKMLAKGYQLKMKDFASKERVNIYEIKNLGLKITEDFRWNIHILNSQRNAYFAYLVHCINWVLNTDLMV